MDWILNAPWWVGALGCLFALGFGMAVGYISSDVSIKRKHKRKYELKAREVK